MKEIRCGNSTDLSFIPKNSVALTVTSPPYHNAINYDSHTIDSEKNYRGTTTQSLKDYFRLLEDVFNREVYRVTKPGGFCAVNIANEITNAKLVPLPHILTVKMLKKWSLHEEIIWNKVGAGTSRFGSTIQHPYPSYFRANIAHENILIFRKGQVKHKKDEKSKIELDESMMRDVCYSIWNIPPVPPRFIEHPCPFPEEIPFRLIKVYTNIGDTVLDPFMGSGQTTKVANYMGRDYIGIDLLEKYVELAKLRVAEKPHLRPQIYAEWKKAVSPSTSIGVPSIMSYTRTSLK